VVRFSDLDSGPRQLLGSLSLFGAPTTLDLYLWLCSGRFRTLPLTTLSAGLLLNDLSLGLRSLHRGLSSLATPTALDLYHWLGNGPFRTLPLTTLSAGLLLNDLRLGLRSLHRRLSSLATPTALDLYLRCSSNHRGGGLRRRTLALTTPATRLLLNDRYLGRGSSGSNLGSTLALSATLGGRRVGSPRQRLLWHGRPQRQRSCARDAPCP